VAIVCGKTLNGRHSVPLGGVLPPAPLDGNAATGVTVKAPELASRTDAEDETTEDALETTGVTVTPELVVMATEQVTEALELVDVTAAGDGILTPALLTTGGEATCFSLDLSRLCAAATLRPLALAALLLLLLLLFAELLLLLGLPLDEELEECRGPLAA